MSFNPELSMEESCLFAKILVGVDGSEYSEKALDFALEVADKFSASVLLLNVFQPPPESEYNSSMFQQLPASGSFQEQIGYQTNMASLNRDLRRVHEAVLSSALERATTLKPNLEITAELKEGDASSQIVETATNGQFDLIIIGHKGDSKIKELFLGSTSEKVAHKASCAVLITK
jgi:nucleotide-binding universal stress UspA family protein